MSLIASTYQGETAKIAVGLALNLLKRKPKQADTVRFVQEFSDQVLNLPEGYLNSESKREDPNGTLSTLEEGAEAESDSELSEASEMVMNPFGSNFQKENNSRSSRRNNDRLIELRNQAFEAIREALRLSDLLSLLTPLTVTTAGPFLVQQLSVQFSKMTEALLHHGEKNCWENLETLQAELVVLLESLKPHSQLPEMAEIPEKFLASMFRQTLNVDIEKFIPKKDRRSTRRSIKSESNLTRRRLAFQMLEETQSGYFAKLALNALLNLLESDAVPKVICLFQQLKLGQLGHCGLVKSVLDWSGWLLLACHCLLKKNWSYCELPRAYRSETRQRLLACKTMIVRADVDFTKNLSLFVKILVLLITICEK